MRLIIHHQRLPTAGGQKPEETPDLLHLHPDMQRMPGPRLTQAHTDSHVHVHMRSQERVASLTVVVVLQVLVQAGGVARPELGQSAAGGAQLRPQVGHLLAGRLDGSIDALGQLLVVIHHLYDLRLRKTGQSRQGVMLTS